MAVLELMPNVLVALSEKFKLEEPLDMETLNATIRKELAGSRMLKGLIHHTITTLVRKLEVR